VKKLSNQTLKKYSIVIAMVFLLFVTINIIYASIQEIPEPLFIAINDEYYYDEARTESLTISYITNKKDTRRVSSILFDDLSEPQFVGQSNGMNGFFFNNQSNDNPYNDLIGRYYTLKRGYINLNLSQVDAKIIAEKGKLNFGKAMVTFSDGTTQVIDLGRHILWPLDDMKNENLNISGGGSGNHYNPSFQTRVPITLKSIDINGFESHKEALDMTLTVDGNIKYVYDDIKKLNSPITVNKRFEIEYLAKEPDINSSWRFNMITIDMTYIKDGQSYETFIYYPFNHINMDETSVEDYVNFWRSLK
jgi:hypothetical protein